MDAVLGVDLELRIAAVIIVEDFVHTRRAVALRRFGEFRQVLRDRDAVILQRQMDRLVFLVVGENETLVSRSNEISPSGRGYSIFLH